MSQMYKVQFESQRGALLERGTYLVCGLSIADAEALVATQLPFPPSTAVFTTSRIKPSIYQLHHSESIDERSPDPKRKEPDIHAPLPIYSEPPPPPVNYRIIITATVRARSLGVAMRRLTEAVLERISAGRVTPDRHVEELAIETGMEPLPDRRLTSLASQSHFKHASFVQGGRASPR
jgi:hypothetical protein